MISRVSKESHLPPPLPQDSHTSPPGVLKLPFPQCSALAGVSNTAMSGPVPKHRRRIALPASTPIIQMWTETQRYFIAGLSAQSCQVVEPGRVPQCVSLQNLYPFHSSTSPRPAELGVRQGSLVKASVTTPVGPLGTGGPGSHRSRQLAI